MGLEGSNLPDDLAGCHALIRRLHAELEEAKRKLSVYVENERREYEAHYGRGVTPQSLLGFGEGMAQAMRRVDQQAQSRVRKKK